MNEKRIMEMLDHPFTLRLEATFQDKDCLYMLLEIVTGGELFDLLADRAPEGVLGTEDAAFTRRALCRRLTTFGKRM